MTDMAGIVYDGSRVKVYEILVRLCEAAGENDEWRDTFWIELLGDEEIYCEFIYYLEHHELREKVRCEGYTLIDLFIWQMGLSNLKMDTGKNTGLCNKESMVLRAYRSMIEMKKNPESFIRRMKEGRGMDQM